MKYQTDDLRINAVKEVVAPEELHRKYAITEAAAKTVFHGRHAVQDIISGNDDRLVVIIGPCSIHDPVAAREYAAKLLVLREELKDDLHIIMRVYFEKPRTTVGWKGLINDPDIDGSFHINKGLCLARSLLLDLAALGLPAATEFLDLVSPQYVADLISWGAIGARTTESQAHRELASGISCPVGFKNGTDGRLQIAVDAIRSASNPHVFLSLTKTGSSAIFSTAGNADCHVILRGGSKPNYDSASIQACTATLEKAGLAARIMVDCSHANSEKKFERQMDVTRDIAGQIMNGEDRIFGVMIESHLTEGRQDVVDGQELVYGQSITDACLGWDDSEESLRVLAEAVRKNRSSKAA